MTPPFPVKAIRGLEVIGGKIAIIEPSISKGNHFIVKHSQTASNLTVYKVPHMQDNSVHLAFCFKLNGKMYYPVVERDSATKEVSIKVKELISKTFDNFPVMYLFRWNTNGEYGSLCSVAQPSQYLSVKDNCITLSTMPDFSFRINLTTYTERMASGNLPPLIPCVVRFSLTPGWPFVVYSDYCTFDEDSEMKKKQANTSNTVVSMHSLYQKAQLTHFY